MDVDPEKKKEKPLRQGRDGSTPGQISSPLDLAWTIEGSLSPFRLTQDIPLTIIFSGLVGEHPERSFPLVIES